MKIEDVINNHLDNIAGVIICKQCQYHITKNKAIEIMEENEGWLYCPSCGYINITNYGDIELED